MTPQRLYAGHPNGMMRQSELPSDRKLSDQRLVLCTKELGPMHARAIEQHKRGLRLTETHQEILVGLLLGDGCLETQNGGRTYRLKIEQSARHEAYARHIRELFSEWVLTPPRRRLSRTSNGTMTINWTFQTVSHQPSSPTASSLRRRAQEGARADQ